MLGRGSLVGAHRTGRALLAAFLAAVVLVPGVTAFAAPPPSDPPTPPTDPLTTPPPPAPGPICTIGGIVRRDTRGPAALCAEQVLLALGYSLTGPDDWFGLSSVNALTAYQRDQGLPPDGIIGEQTGDRLGIWNGPRGTVAAPAPASCTIGGVVWLDTRGPAALCAEQVLIGLGYRLTGPDDWFGASSVSALRHYQRDQGLGVDGIIGEGTGDRLGIWAGPRGGRCRAVAAPEPQDRARSRRTPDPAAASSTTAVSNASGPSRRTAPSSRRTWYRAADSEPYAGTYRVYSRSMYTQSTEQPDVKWRYMVRFAHGPDGGRIGFHEIPNRNGVALQSERQLGQPLSGGCVRQSTADAIWMWNWARLGTTVVVL